MVMVGSHTGSTGEVLFWEDTKIYKVRLNNGDIISMSSDDMQLLR